MKKLIITLAATSLILSGLQASAYAEGINHSGKSPNHIEHADRGLDLAKKLNLNEEQSKRAKEIREQSRSQIKPIIDELRVEKQKFRTMVQNNASKEELQSQKDKIKDLMNRVREIHKQNLAGFEQILNPEQKTEFEKIKKSKMEKFKKFKEKRQKNWKKGNFDKYKQ